MQRIFFVLAAVEAVWLSEGLLNGSFGVNVCKEDFQ